MELSDIPIYLLDSYFFSTTLFSIFVLAVARWQSPFTFLFVDCTCTFGMSLWLGVSSFL